MTFSTAEIIVAKPEGYKPHIIAEARKVYAHRIKIRAKQAAAKRAAAK